MGFSRTRSIEAIARGWAPQTAQWYGRESAGRARFEDAAAALAGVSQPALAFWLWSTGHRDQEHEAVIRGHLGALFAERWPARRYAALLALCLDELSHGRAIGETDRHSDAERARRAGIGKSQWWATWRRRYLDVLRAASEQVSIAESVIGPRLIDITY